jgi:RNA polymerase sigma-70 factor, ECF subfamily
MREIYDAHAVALRRFLFRLSLGDSEITQDILQETFLRAWRNIHVLPTDIHNLRPWLYTVARNVAIDLGRARKSRPPELGVEDIGRLPSADDEAERLVNAHTIRAALPKLTEVHRQVLVELYYRDSSTAEAANRLGIPEGTVKSRAYYALRALHTAIGAIEET